MKNKYVVLLSGGLDSTVNFFEAHQEGQVVLALNFNYGQKATMQEIKASKKLTDHLGVKLKVIDLPWFQDFGKSSLLRSDLEIPRGSAVDIVNHKQSLVTAKSVWVPNRNGIFLNIAAGFAEALEANAVVPGFNLEEAETFSDNSKDFMLALDKSFSFSTANHVRVKCYTDQMSKNQIVKRALELKVPLDMMWPCYDLKSNWCGVCESCQRAKRAFNSSNLDLKKYFLE